MPPILAALLALPALVASGRGALRHSALEMEEPAGDDTDNVAAIHEKWDKMDDFLEVMFTIACKWKHSKDINGLAAEKLKNGDLKTANQVRDFKKKTQKTNVQYVHEACGKIVAKSERKCRQGCADRFGEAFAQRSQCDGKCVQAYTNFEKSCKQRAEHLEEVYAMKLSAAEARTTCYEGFCEEFPSVWLKEQDAMTAEVDTRCGEYCAEDLVEKRCQMKWQLQVDFVKNDITDSCFGEGKVKECFKEKSDAAGTAQGECATNGKTECQAQQATCESEGNVDQAAKEAKEFCTDRSKMCETQVTQHCLDEHKAALEKGKTECEGSDAGALEKCQSEKLGEKETEAIASCKEERTPKCNEECHGKCNVDKMNNCLANLESDHDPAEHFCKDFWQLLHESSEIDPVTGSPIVLLAASKH